MRPKGKPDLVVKLELNPKGVIAEADGHIGYGRNAADAISMAMARAGKFVVGMGKHEGVQNGQDRSGQDN